jgi:uncharacterized protein
MAYQIAILVPAGFLTGIIAALFGVGGGAVYVPLVYALMMSNGASVDAAMKLGVGTSLFTMFFTTMSAGVGHYRMGSYVRRAAPALVISGLMCAFIGARLGVVINGEMLKRIFAGVLLFVSVRTFIKIEPSKSGEPIDNTLYFILIGALAGILSSLVGVGGGIVIVPALTILLHQPFLKSIGTSSIVIIFTSFIGAVTYVTAPHIAAQDSWIVGHVNVVFAAVLIPTSVAGAWTGVRIASRAPTRILKPLFATFLFIISIQMMGISIHQITHWLH